MQCRHIKDDKTQCKGFAIKGSDYCWRHSSAVKDYDKKSASALGGSGRRLYMPVTLPEIVIKDMQDIPHMLVDTLGYLRRGEMDIRLGTAIGYITNILMKSYELADLEPRIEKIEKYIAGNLKGEITDDYKIT